MKIKLLAFAAVKDIVGGQEQELEVPESTNVGALRDSLEERYPMLKGYRTSMRMMVNEDYADDSQVLSENDEIALIPPVSGGSEGGFPLIELVYDPIDEDAVVRSVEFRDGVDGAVLAFKGISRRLSMGQSIEYLDYDAYPPAAVKAFHTIAAEIKEQFGVERLAVTHRLGKVPVGEVSVVIAVASPHRAEGFSACRHVIERIKEIVPIWKKEVSEDGEVWIEGDPTKNKQ